MALLCKKFSVSSLSLVVYSDSIPWALGLLGPGMPGHENHPKRALGTTAWWADVAHTCRLSWAIVGIGLAAARAEPVKIPDAW